MDRVPLAGGEADLSQQVLFLEERRVPLTTKERDLLAYLAGNPGRTVTRQELVVNVWKSPAHASDEPIYSVVKRLRAKIDRGEHRHIVSVHGDGYRWAPPPNAEPARPQPQVAAPGTGSVPGTRFFGRGAEISIVAHAVDGGATLVTLVGPGGVGKTRCAREIASSKHDVFCDLSSATTETSILAAVAAALEVPLDGALPADWVRGVGRALAAAPDRLVVLDNAEQAIEAVAGMAKSWMASGATLLVTSREPLGVEGEQVVPIEPLQPADAVALFADRAAAAGMAPRDAALQALIVERVDRLPLAIELAAAQAPHLGEKALLEGLDAQLATLVTGPRHAPPRHATLRAAVEWSWTVLHPREHHVLEQLAVFAGAFSLDAARAVVQSDDVVAIVASLCRRSQLRRDGERFALYAAVRELAWERAEDRPGIEARRAAHYARAGEAAAALLEGPRHAEGAAVLTAELAEMRAAWKRTLERDGVLAARLALVLDRALGLVAEKAWARRDLLARTRRVAHDPVLVCELLLAEGRIEGAATAPLDQALEVATSRRVRAEIHLARGERLGPTGLAAARKELEQARDLATAEGIEPLRGRALAALGEAFWAHGLAAEASASLRAALSVHLEAGDRRAVARTSALLAHVERVETGGGSARALLRQAEKAASELGEPVVKARVLMDLGQHLTRTGDQTGARAALAEAAALFERVGFARDRALLHLHVAETLVGIGELDRALEETQEALAALPDPSDVARSTLHEAMGCIYMLRNDLVEASRWIEAGLAIARANGAARSECTLLAKRGLLHLVRGAPERGWDDVDEAVRKNEARGAIALVGSSLADRAMLAFALGREADGERDLERAREILHRPSDDEVDGRMLAGCEIVGRHWGAIRAGAAARQVRARAAAKAARYLDKVPRSEWDVVARLLDWLVGRIGHAAA